MAVELYRGGLDEDLRPLSAALWQQRIAHRVVEDNGTQLVLLASEADGQRAADLPPAPARAAAGGFAQSLRRAPVTAALIVCGFAGFLLLYLGAPISWVSALTYDPFTIEDGRPVFGAGQGEFWRMVTPVFLHFGWLHVVFNSLWCWELGRRIEAVLGSLNLFGLFLVTAVLSNGIQHWVTGPVLFGGLSGVVYGFLAFAWVAGRLNPRWRMLAPATPIMLFMVGWLVICMLGVFDVLGFSVANGAHVGGLLTGAVIGAVFAFAYRGGDSSA